MKTTAEKLIKTIEMAIPFVNAQLQETLKLAVAAAKDELSKAEQPAGSRHENGQRLLRKFLDESTPEERREIWEQVKNVGNQGPTVEEYFQFGQQPAGWISVKDRFPDGRQLVIVQGGVAYYDFKLGGWYTVTCFAYPGQRIQWDVTHWQPLPELPEVSRSEPKGE